MKRYIFIPLILTSMVSFSSCKLFKTASVLLDDSPMKIQKEIGGKYYRSVDLSCPYQLLDFTYDALPSAEQLENSPANQELGKTKEGFGYFYAKTFYVTNTDKRVLDYKVKLTFTNRSGNLDQVIRVMFFANPYDSDDHLNYIYAMPSNHGTMDEEGNISYQEYISTEEYGRCENFVNANTICVHTFSGFRPNDIMRFTVVFWLEGYDPDARNEETPSSGLFEINYSDSYSEA